MGDSKPKAIISATGEAQGLGGLAFSVPESEEDVFFEPNGEEF